MVDEVQIPEGALYGVWSWESPEGHWTGTFFFNDDDAAEADEALRRSGFHRVVRAVSDDIDDTWLDDIHV